MLDFVLNGKGHGKVATRLLKCGGDPNCLRPYEEEDGRSYITVNFDPRTGQMLKEPQAMLTNADAILRKDEWIRLDEAVIGVGLPRLKFVADLRSNPRTSLTIPNALAQTIFQYQKMSTFGQARVSMDGRNRGLSDRPMYSLDGIPLPILHADFEIDYRELLISRNHASTALDVTSATRAGRLVAELAEQMAIGTAATFAFGSYSIYGATNFPDRNTFTLANPTGGGWIPEDTFDDVQSMIDLLKGDHFYGPYRLYHGNSWSKYMNGDYSAAKGTNTLRQRILDIDSIESVRELDFLTGYQMILVQMDGEVVRELVGMDLTTVSWEEEGGMFLKFKVMAMLIPQFRSDFDGQCGLCHGNV